MLVPGGANARMRARTGTSEGPAWVTRAEAAFLAHVPVEEVDRRIAEGRLACRHVGSLVLVDPAGLRPGRTSADVAEPARPPAAGDRIRPPAELRAFAAPHRRLLPRGALVVGCVVVGVTASLLGLQHLPFGGDDPPVSSVGAARPSFGAPTPTPSLRVGRDPFASPFAGDGQGQRRGAVLVKPPGVVREGGLVAAATTVVNRSRDRWLPPSELTFVARDATGTVIATSRATVTVAPGGSQAVVAPSLGVDPASIATIEARLHPAPLHAGRYRPPPVRVASADVVDGGKAISGVLTVDRGAGAGASLACAVFDPLDELAGVSTTTVDLTRANGGRLRFWLTLQPQAPGPYRAACSAS